MSKLYVKSIDKCVQCPACVSECFSLTKVRLYCKLWGNENESNVIGDSCLHMEEKVAIPSWCKLEVIG